MRKETMSVQSGTYHDTATGGVNTPIFTSSAIAFMDQDDIYYPRYFNTPNQNAVVQKLCALEGAQAGLLFSSGMAAISTSILSFAGAGDHVVMLDSIYGGTHAFATDVFHKMGLSYSFVATDPHAIDRAITPATKLIVIESPTNPLLEIVDIRRIAEVARARGIVTLIDNTFATPILQNPLALGIDIVVHSGTKYLGGHSDICCGAVLASRDHIARILPLARNLGGSLNANTCYLLERSLKTLAIRVERQTANAAQLAQFLTTQPAIERVYYPGLSTHPGHEIARTQMTGFGAMLSFELRQTQLTPDTLLRRFQLIQPAVSLGGIETMITSPVQTSHAKMSAEERQRVGITERLLRLSVGIEHVEDLIADLKQALHPTG